MFIPSRKNFKQEKQTGFILLFAVTLAGVLLAIGLGVSNIALQELSFSTSARDTNDAFFAADVGVECALQNDKIASTVFSASGAPGTLNCLGANIQVSGSYPSWDFVLTNLGTSGQACAKVNLYREAVFSSSSLITTITSRGYNIGDSQCNSTSVRRIERELKATYGSSSTVFVFLDATPRVVAYNGSTTLDWYSNNATSCVASLDWSGSKDLSGSQTMTNLTSNKSYRLTCSGPTGSTGVTVNVAVGAEPCVPGTGGTVSDITTMGGIRYRVHTFSSSGTFVAPSGTCADQIEYLVVAGGGGGGGVIGGGGGAGGMRTGTLSLTEGNNYPVVVGMGGTGGKGFWSGAEQKGNDGQNSSFAGIIAIGGGGGSSNAAAGSGGSGGGGGGNVGCAPAEPTGGAGSSGQGNAGGDSLDTCSKGAGGGGASQAGLNTGTNGGNGGAGTVSSISGSSVTYAGGGGGGVDWNIVGTAGVGGAGGGGNGSKDNYPADVGARSGTDGLGGGGGGAGWLTTGGDTVVGGRGGNGIVIVRYLYTAP